MTAQTTPKVLVVNDDPGSLLGLVGLLSQWEEELGFEVKSARSGPAALREVLRQDFAVILLDVNMPGMNGFETARAIHSRQASASTPIIFMTAYLADEINRLKGYEHGAVDYLFTPFIPQALKSKLTAFVALAKQKNQLKAQADALSQRTEELVIINQQLQLEIDRRREAEQRTKTSEEFLAMLGHELRNPLAAISNAGVLLSMKGVNEQQVATAVNVVQRQTGQLVRIVDDLLDLSRVLAGKIQLSRCTADLGQIVRSCLDTLAIAGRTQHHTFDVKVECGMVDADPARMEQVVTNLIDNAIKYTPHNGNIDVQVSTTSDEVILTVRDSGVGMSPQLLSRIFDVFVQGEQPLNRPKGGLGIGLALVRQLVNLHGGMVTAQSNTGSGSVFEIRLPKHVSEAAEPLAVLDNSEFQTHSVLLVEDNPDSLEVMNMLLGTLGHRIFTAANGDEGIAVAQHHQPAIALIDIGLPGMSGYEIAQKMKSDPATAGIKLIALTGYGLEHDRAKALEAGFDMHLVKPVSPERLSKAIEDCMSHALSN
jgi:signal transduction histidine kinase